MPAGVDRVNWNGILKDYDPPSGINNVSEIVFDPTAMTYATSMTVAVPQGDSGGVTTLTGNTLVISDAIWDGISQLSSTIPINKGFDGAGNPVVTRTVDTGFGTTVKSTSGNRYFTCNVQHKGTTSGSEPTAEGLDGSVYWVEITPTNQFKGTWQANTAYVLGDIIVDSVNTHNSLKYFWRCTVSGTSGSSAPFWQDSTAGPASVADGPNVFWNRRGVYRGVWASTTSYGGTVDTSDRHYIYRDGVTIANNPNKFLVWNAATLGTFQTTSSEPSWSASGDNLYWEEGNFIWNAGSKLTPGPAQTNGDEQLVITGLLAPSTDGKRLRITNGGLAGSNMQVVIADHDNMHPPNQSPADSRSRPPTDGDSASGNRFKNGGFDQDVYLRPGVFVDLEYVSADSCWKLAKKVYRNIGYPRSRPALVGHGAGRW